MTRNTALLLLLLWTACAWGTGSESVNTIPAQDANFVTRIQTHLRSELPATLTRLGEVSFVSSGGLHATAGTCTSAALSLDATTSSGNRITADGAGGTVAIAYSASNIAANCANPGSDVCWVVGSASGQDFSAAGARTIVTLPTLAGSAFNRVGSSNLFADCTSSTQPTLPTDSVWLMRVVITNGAIAKVDSLANPLPVRPSSQGVMVSIKEYGAKVDGSTDDANAVETALASVPAGSIVFVPAGTTLLSRNIYSTRSNVTLQGTGAGSILKATAGFTNTGNTALLNFGYSVALGDVAVSNITVRDLTVDGRSLVRTLYFDSVTDGLISHVTALNAGPTHPSITVYLGADVTVERSRVSGTLGQFGDGIYFQSVARPRALFNAVDNVTRIGIVTEGAAGGLQTTDALFEGNSVTNANNATGGECNAGYWMEHTTGGRVSNNVASNLDNTPGACPSRGIQMSFGNGTDSVFLLTNNTVSGAQTGLFLSPNPSASVLVDGLRVAKGTLANYKIGVEVDQGAHIDIRHLSCGTNTFSNDAYGCVMVNMQSAINSLTISDSVVGDGVAGGMTHTTNSADFNVYAAVGTLTAVTLHNLQNWRSVMRQPATRVYVSDSFLTHNATTYPVFQATGNLLVTNTRLLGETVTSDKWFGAQIAANDQFLNVVFDTVVANIANAGVSQRRWACTGCSFVNGSQLAFDGKFFVSLDSSYFNEWAAGGAILKAGAATAGFDIRVRNTDFVHTDATNTPLRLGGGNAASMVTSGVSYTTTAFSTNDRISALTLNTRDTTRTFADLGTPANGTVVMCSDCTFATPCAGGGTGATAKRANGIWVCD